MKIVAKFSQVKKQFGDVTALQSISFEVAAGQSVALLGPNGAGKSTALSILQGLRAPTSGSVELFGAKPGSRAAMQRVGVTPQLADFSPQMTPAELLDFARAHYPAPRALDDLIEVFDIGAAAGRRVEGFSGGEKRRVALAMAFAGNPELAILDEPTTGLDAAGQAHFQDIAVDFVRRGASLIVTSHYWPEIEKIADHIIMIDRGRTIMDGSVEAIKKAVGLNRVTLRGPANARFLENNFTSRDGVWTTARSDTDTLIRELVASRVEYSELTVSPLGLEEAIAIYRSKPGTEQ